MSSRNLRGLENIFGAIPSSVCEHIKYLSCEDGKEKFICILCDKVFQKSAPQVIEDHLMSRSHKNASSSRNEISQALMKTYRGKIPQIVHNNIDVLDINRDGYECVICDKNLTENNFFYHLLSSGHEKNRDDYNATIEKLRDVFGGIPEVVSNNKEFLHMDSFGKNYVCTICHVSLIVYKNDFERTEHGFTYHLCSIQHINRVKLFRIKSLIPEMQQTNERFPNYLMRSIDYLSTNGADLFCSACNENIKYIHNDIWETKENLKLHILSEGHADNVFSRQDCSSEMFDNLNRVIDDFTGGVLKNLRYLELNNNSFICSICKVEICIKSNCYEVKDCIIHHFESKFHDSNVSEDIRRQASLIENLKDIFGGLSTLIEDNIAYIKFIGNNNFQCTLCDAILQSKKNGGDVEHTRKITEENFEKHLNSNEHVQALASDRKVSKLLQRKLEELFEPIPECIYINLDNLKYISKSGNFQCILCDETIIVDYGNKKEDITLQNFKDHLLSTKHKTKIKCVANREIQCLRKLESIFGGVPGFILSNVEYLYHNEEDKDSFICDICDAEVHRGSYPESTRRNFHKHLSGSRHKSNVEEIDTSISLAFQFLDNNFCVPEFLLRDIDFWDNTDDDSSSDLYCNLCQKVLSVDLQNLKQTRQSLQCHMESERHKYNLEHF